MLSFEEKKAVFRSFNLAEKQIRNGRVNFNYPESIQRGQVVGTQLHTSGNGYVVGKYLSPEIIEQCKFQLDSRGWISIKDFTKDQLTNVISEAIKSMSSSENEEESLQILEEKEAKTGKTVTVESPVPVKQEIRYPCVSRWLWWSNTILEFNNIIWRNIARK